MRSRAWAALALSASVLLGWASGVAPSSAQGSAVAGGAAATQRQFVRHVTNPFYPLSPGTLLVYRGIKDGESQVDHVYVTYRTRMIQGVRTTAVRDIARHRGRLLEKTVDWFAQDKAGNVWYFGERTRAYENGGVSTEGSWVAGVRGARAGIIMEADPHAVDAYRQEYDRGNAQDTAWVLRRGGTIRVPYGRLHHKLLTMEWSPLEPGVIDKKTYARGIGIVSEEAASGPLETAELVRIRHIRP
jgi:hypothetical protein